MAWSPERERDLVERCIAQDKKAWDELLELCYPTVSSIVRWKKWNAGKTEQEDLIQDCFEALIKSLHAFEFRCSLETLAYRICLNTCVSYIRKGAVTQRYFCGEALVASNPDSPSQLSDLQIADPDATDQEAALMRKQEAAALDSALKALDEQCKTLIRRRYLMEQSVTDISEDLGLKKNTLVVKLKRCMNRILKVLDWK